MKNKSTYSILLNADAEEKGRSIFETAVYSLVVLCAAVSCWSFVASPVTLPGQAAKSDHPTTLIANAFAKKPAMPARG